MPLKHHNTANDVIMVIATVRTLHHIININTMEADSYVQTMDGSCIYRNISYHDMHGVRFPGEKRCTKQTYKHVDG